MRLRLLAVAGLLVIGSCANAGGDDHAPAVVATTSILGDIVSNIVGSGVEVRVLMPIGVDPHEFQPSPSQVASIARADLVVANGGGLEEGLEDVLQSAKDDGVAVVEVLAAADPIATGGGLDPHFWLDPSRVALVVQFLAEEMGELTATDRVVEYLEQLATVEQASQALFAELEPNDRAVVTNHDSLSYLAERLGFEVVGVVIPGGSSMGEPSSQELAELVKAIVGHDVRAIFVDTAEPTALAEAVAGEVGHPVEIVELYTGSLGGPGSGAETLVEMILVDARRIADALRR